MKKALSIVLSIGLLFAVAFQPCPENGRRWYAVALHSHTRYSEDAALNLKSLLLAAGLEGGDFVAITDHRNTKSITDEEFKPQFGVIPIPGEEWGVTGLGHAGIVGLTEGGTGPVKFAKGSNLYSTMTREATERGALVFISHPFHSKSLWPAGWLTEMSGVEAWNAPWWFPTSRNQQATNWWQTLLAERETKITGIAVSDFHFPFIQSVMHPCVMIYAESRSVADIMEGLKHGHVIMAAGPHSPKIYLSAETGQDEIQYMVGDSISVTKPTTVTFRILTTGSSSLDQVFIYTRAGRLETEDRVAGLGRWESTFDLEFEPEEKNFVRVELRSSVLSWPQSMTNPIYINY